MGVCSYRGFYIKISTYPYIMDDDLLPGDELTEEEDEEDSRTLMTTSTSGT